MSEMTRPKMLRHTARIAQAEVKKWRMVLQQLNDVGLAEQVFNAVHALITAEDSLSDLMQAIDEENDDITT